MLIGALGAFTLVAVMGAMMFRSVWGGHGVEPFYAVLHAAAALFGSALVIAAAVEGDTRLYANIGLAVVIIVLGVAMGVASKKGKRVPKALLVTHVGLAVGCYGLLAFLALNPYATLM